jgi:hypothetical protein
VACTITYILAIDISDGGVAVAEILYILAAGVIYNKYMLDHLGL